MAMHRLVSTTLIGAVVHSVRQVKRQAKPSKTSYEQPILDAIAGRLMEDPKASTLPPAALDEIPTCHLSTSDCRIEDMTGPTLVYTDPATTRCYSGDPFAFFVSPGAADKLYYYFPGGGGCFEFPGWIPGHVEACFPDMGIALYALGLGAGAHDPENPNNALRDHTLITAPYCSGGGHIANVSFTLSGKTYYQYGYNHNKILQDWAVKNIRTRLSSFVVMGSSAGSLGAGIWADTLLSTFTYDQATFVFDSYMSIFPGGAQGGLVRQMTDGCALPLVDRYRTACLDGSLLLMDILDYTMAKYPNVAFAHIHSKLDAIQLAFYGLIGLHFGGGISIAPKDFYAIANYMMNVYNKYPNYVTYIVNGDFHVFPVFPVEWYSTSILGPNTTAPAGTPMLYEWFNRLITREPVNSECAGDRVQNGAGGAEPDTYCDEVLFPKTLRV